MSPESIKNLRTILQLSQAEFGAKIGQSPQAVSEWERGRRNPDRLAVEKMEQIGGEKEEKKRSSKKKDDRFESFIWICPACGRSCSPFELQCECGGKRRCL